MEEAERKIKRETLPGGSHVDTLLRRFKGDSASMMKINLDAEESGSTERSGCASRHRRKGKGKAS